MSKLDSDTLQLLTNIYNILRTKYLVPAELSYMLELQNLINKYVDNTENVV